MNELVFTVNRNRIAFTQGQTILEAAADAGIPIPTLCHLKGAAPTGACRICVVEVKGARSLMTACSTPAAAGMEVLTESPRVIAARRMVLELLMSSGNHNCAAKGEKCPDWTRFQLDSQQVEGTAELCPAWGDCRLQELAFQYQVGGQRFEGAREYPRPETVNPMVIRDFSRCILCGRCVQACKEIQFNRAIDGEETADISLQDAAELNLHDGETIRVCPRRGAVRIKARVTHRIPRGLVWMSFHFRETCANWLTNPAFDPAAWTAEYKACAVRIEKLDAV